MHVHTYTPIPRPGGGGAHTHHGVASDPSEFHTRFFQTGQRVSDACTKVAMLFSKPPAPTVAETGTLCGLLEQSTLQLASIYFQVSPCQGNIWHVRAIPTYRAYQLCDNFFLSHRKLFPARNTRIYPGDIGGSC